MDWVGKQAQLHAVGRGGGERRRLLSSFFSRGVGDYYYYLAIDGRGRRARGGSIIIIPGVFSLECVGSVNIISSRQWIGLASRSRYMR